METKTRPASSKQLGYIRRLQEQMGLSPDGGPQGMNSLEASQMIGQLLEQRQSTEEFVSADTLPASNINQARLGMAMKECFRLWRGNRHDILEQRRKPFIKNVVATYNLFTEIAEILKGKRQLEPARKIEETWAEHGSENSAQEGAVVG